MRFFFFCSLVLTLWGFHPNSIGFAQERAENPLSGEGLFQKGLRLYGEKNWPAALEIFGKAAEIDPYNDAVMLYLGTVYLILGRDQHGEKALIAGVNLQGEHMSRIAFILGNYYFSLARYKRALDAYNLATWGEKQVVQAFLNRANLYLTNGYYSNALNDYLYFLFRKPFDRQRDEIEKMIAKLRNLGAKSRIDEDGSIVGGLTEEIVSEGGTDLSGLNGEQGGGVADPGRGIGPDGETKPVLPGSGEAEGRAVNPGLGIGRGEEERPVLPGSGEAEGRAVNPGLGIGRGEEERPRLSGTGANEGGGPPELSGAGGRSLLEGVRDNGNTVGSGGDESARNSQREIVRNAVRGLNQNAMILPRDNPDIERGKTYSGIDE